MPCLGRVMQCVDMECAACDSGDVRFFCGVCCEYAFCSYECSDALALEHAARCYDRKCDNPKYITHIANGLMALVGVNSYKTIENLLDQTNEAAALLIEAGKLYGIAPSTKRIEAMSRRKSRSRSRSRSRRRQDKKDNRLLKKFEKKAMQEMRNQKRQGR